MSPQRIITLFFLLLVALYALFQARFLILGPEIVITSPMNGAVLSDSHLSVTGVATHITSISLDGRPILIDTSGNFSEKLLLPPGPSILTMIARDRFGRQTERQLQVVLQE